MAASIVFIGERLWTLDWSALQPHVSWSVVVALLGALALFATADQVFALGWAATVDPTRRIPVRDIARIYGHGVLMKYLPGAVFQYFGRHIGGKKAGLAHAELTRSTMIEVGLHLVSSLTVAAACRMFDKVPLVSVVAIAILVCGCLLARRPLLTALALQIIAFSAFAVAAMLIGLAVLPTDASLADFAGLFLLAWLAGFVVPVAPGGIGIREAALLALAGNGLPAATVLASTLALRAASIFGDMVYGFIAMILPEDGLAQKSLKIGPPMKG
ncbi:MAG TPA: hypothetical protein VNS79_07780 [Sphingobium sp.]|nr:hypothetical protein [Sphingobium sp.]